MVFNNRQRGDTLVEVLTSIVVMSVVIVGALTIMSRGLSQGQTSVEHSQVRLGVNSQIELLTFLRDQYVISPGSDGGIVWKEILDQSNTTQSTYDESCTPTPAKQTAGYNFYLTRTGNKVVRKPFNPTLTPQTHAIAGQGLWVEVTNAPSTIDPPYADFVIRACWPGSGGFAQQRTVTAIRLYSPYDPLP